MIPVGPNELSWERLVPDLEKLTVVDEVVIVAIENSPIAKTVSQWQKNDDERRSLVFAEKPGRGIQLNLGARAARFSTLWFLHADMKLSSNTAKALIRHRGLEKKAVYYFDLGFFEAGILMRINEAGLWLRSHLLKLPFGDQGFLMSRESFEEAGDFLEGCRGEDHYFIWQAHHKGIPVEPIGAKLYTSARRYKEQGWQATTWEHLSLTCQQAFPEFKKLMRHKWYKIRDRLPLSS